jgi:hypothetical protein
LNSRAQPEYEDISKQPRIAVTRFAFLTP